MEFNNKSVIISGASSGIGKATAIFLAKKGAKVILLARNESALKEVCEEIKNKGGKANYYSVDLTDYKKTAETCEKIKNDLGTPNVIVNNAGIGKWLFVEETEYEDVAKMMSAPYYAAFYLTKAFLPEMIERESGHIINLTSPAGFVVWPGATAYTTARWAMRGFSKALKADMSRTNIKVALFVPGKVSSEYFKNNPGSEERIPKIDKIFPTLTPEQTAYEIGNIISKGKTGEVITPPLIKITILFHRIFPRIVEYLVEKTGWYRK